MTATPHSPLPRDWLAAGGERPDLEVAIPALYGALFEAIRCRQPPWPQRRRRCRPSRLILPSDGHACRSRPAGLPFAGLIVGVRCPIEESCGGENAGPPGSYATGEPGDPLRRCCSGRARSTSLAAPMTSRSTPRSQVRSTAPWPSRGAWTARSRKARRCGGWPPLLEG